MGRHGQGKPRIQLEESCSGVRYKKTDSDAHPERSAVEKTAYCGLDWNPQSPGYWRPAAGRPKPPTYAPARCSISDHAAPPQRCSRWAAGRLGGRGRGTATLLVAGQCQVLPQHPSLGVICPRFWRFFGLAGQLGEQTKFSCRKGFETRKCSFRARFRIRNKKSCFGGQASKLH